MKLLQWQHLHGAVLLSPLYGAQSEVPVVTLATELFNKSVGEGNKKLYLNI